MRQFLRTILRILDGSPSSPMVAGNRQRGQSMLELAFITPLLAILVAGAVEVGWYTNRWLSLLEITRVGARSATFLQGELSPLQWDDNASIHPDIQETYLLIPPGDPRHDAAVNARECESGSNYGFYSFIVCIMETSLSPLELQTHDTAVDDIVISVFAIQNVNNARWAGTDGAPAENGGIRPVYREVLPLSGIITPTEELYKITYDLNANGYRNDYPPGLQSIVVGRYPIKANECNMKPAVGGPELLETTDSAFEYDPFDYLQSGQSIGNTTSENPYTGSTPYVLEVRDESTGLDFSDTDAEFQRGFVYLGQHRVDDPSVYCYGSEFTMREVEVLLNMPRFIQPDLYDPPPGNPGDPDYNDWVEEVYDSQDDRLYFEPQGLTLVEVFWEHSLLLDFPLFRPLQEAYDDAMIISLWSAFPLPTAAPNITYQLP